MISADKEKVVGQNIRQNLSRIEKKKIIWKTWPFAHPLFYSIPKSLNKNTFPEQMHHSFRVVFAETVCSYSSMKEFKLEGSQFGFAGAQESY